MAISENPYESPQTTDDAESASPQRELKVDRLLRYFIVGHALMVLACASVHRAAQIQAFLGAAAFLYWPIGTIAVLSFWGLPFAIGFVPMFALIRNGWSWETLILVCVDLIVSGMHIFALLPMVQ